MKNEKFRNAVNGVAQKVPPIWFMRQAGRYHSHYQGMKKDHSFIELCKVPELAAEVARGPVAEFGFDVSIMFSDLLFPLEAMGLGLEYAPGPILDKKLDHNVLKNLKTVDDAIEGVRFQKDVALATREVLPADVSLIGFVGGPWTLFTYAVEGSHKALMTDVKTDMGLYAGFCEKLMPLLEQNIQLQLDGGVELVMIFDTAAGELCPWMYREWIAPVLENLAKKFPGKLGYYSQKTQNAHISGLLDCGLFAGFGYDHRWELANVLKAQKSGFVQGNFDQTLLFADESTFKSYLLKYLKPFQELDIESRKSWVCGLGHGVLPKTPERNVHTFIKIIREVFGE